MARTGRRRVAALAALLVLAAPVHAGRVADVHPHRHDGWIAVTVRTADLLDARTRSTVESGLPGSARLLLELRDASDDVVARRAVERVLEFDLWEGVARVREATRERTFRSIDAADSAWALFRSVPLVRLDRVDPGRELRVMVRVEVESFGAEERARVSRYVSESARGEERELTFDLGGLVGRLVGAGRAGDGEVWTGAAFRATALDTVAGPGETRP